MKNIIFGIFFLLGINVIFSQSDLDSINKYLYSDLKKADCYARKFLTKSSEQKRYRHQIQAYYYLGYIKKQIDDIDSTLYFYEKGQKIAAKHDFKELLLNIKVNKAILFYNNYYYQDALDLYKEASTLALDIGKDDIKKQIDVFIALIKQKTGKEREALKIFKNSYVLAKGAKEKSLLELYLAKTFLSLNQLDSTQKYALKGLTHSKQNNDVELEIHFINAQGIESFKRHNLKKAEELFDLALKKAIDVSSDILEDEVWFNIAQLNQLKGDLESSNDILKDLTEGQEERSVEELASYYKLFAENYKLLDSVELSNSYFEKFVEVNNEKNNKRFKTAEDLHKIDLENITVEKEKQKKQKLYLVLLVASLLLLLIGFYFRNKAQKKLNQTRFEELMLKIKDFEAKKDSNEPVIKELEKEELIKPDVISVENEVKEEKKIEAGYVIKDEKVLDILNRLKKLEEKQYFLKQECTLHNAAKKLKTNTAYLSKIINNELGKNFSTYINELRINYAILELKNNPRLRSYSTKAIAEEMGYKSSDSFTRYFKLATGITPTVFIKKINDL